MDLYINADAFTRREDHWPYPKLCGELTQNEMESQESLASVICGLRSHPVTHGQLESTTDYPDVGTQKSLFHSRDNACSVRFGRTLSRPFMLSAEFRASLPLSQGDVLSITGSYILVCD